MTKHVPEHTKNALPTTQLKLDQLPLGPLIEIFKNLSAAEIVLGITPLSQSLNAVAKSNSLWKYKLGQDFPNYPDNEHLKDKDGRPDYFETYKRAYFTNTDILLDHIKNDHGKALNQAISYLNEHKLFETVCKMEVYDTATNQVFTLNEHLGRYKYTKSKIAEVMTNADIKVDISLVDAVRYGDLAEVKKQLDNEVPVDSVDSHHRSALHHAVLKANTNPESLAIVKVLLEHQANPNLSDGYQTPLDLANDDVKSFVNSLTNQMTRRKRIEQAGDYFDKGIAALSNDNNVTSHVAMFKKPGDKANYYFELASQSNELTLIGCVKDKFKELNKKKDGKRLAQKLAKQSVITNLDDEEVQKLVKKHGGNKVGRTFRQGGRFLKRGANVMKDGASNLGHRIHMRSPR